MEQQLFTAMEQERCATSKKLDFTAFDSCTLNPALESSVASDQVTRTITTHVKFRNSFMQHLSSIENLFHQRQGIYVGIGSRLSVGIGNRLRRKQDLYLVLTQ